MSSKLLSVRVILCDTAIAFYLPFLVPCLPYPSIYLSQAIGLTRALKLAEGTSTDLRSHANNGISLCDLCFTRNRIGANVYERQPVTFEV